MKNRGLKKIWGHNWDYYYLLRLEQRKISEMARDFTKWRHHVGWERTVWEMNLCVQLIDIILENDKYYNSWLNANYGVNGKFTEFPLYVNLKNYKRFFKQVDTLPDNNVLYEHFKIEVRKVKALHLYNRIRALKLMTWWD
jgi:hypothetical protein